MGEGCAGMGVGVSLDGGTGACGGPRSGATKRVTGVPKWVRGTHVDGSIRVFVGAPYGATRR
eukprot:4092240-Pyramimonas_sp.AAC.1